MSRAIEKQVLVQTLVDEASDIDLVCYLARSGGETALKDLLECIRDAEGLSLECGFRSKPATCSELMSAIVPI